MTYEEFYEIIKETYSYVETKRSFFNKGDGPWRYWNNGDDDSYFVEWIVGGASGGNCWGDSPSYGKDAEPEPEIDFVDLFEKICPNMTFLQYRKVMKDIETYSDRSENEYYGNYTNYRKKTVKYRDLYDRLVEYKVIEE